MQIHNGDLTTCMGYYNQDELQNTIGTLMSDTICDNEINAENAILHHKEGVDLIPANLDLSAIEFSLVNAMSREFTLKNSIRGIKDNYDYVLIDCMPSLGMITINALACSDKIIIPVQGEYLATKGMGHLLKTVTRVQKQINPNLKIGGVLLTLVDKRTNLSKDVRDTLTDNYGQYVKIYGAEIPNAWCACYVSWCANECGYIEKGIIPKFSVCTDGINWFKEKNEWHDRGESYYPIIGDIILGFNT